MTLKKPNSFEITNSIANIFLFLLLGITFLFFIRQIVFVNADLGRHLKNGELFLSDFQFFTTNFYSYTEPNFPTVTHHWGAGVILYLIFSAFGFKGLTIFYALIHIFAIFILYKAIIINAKKEFTLLSIILVIPLLTFRTEIRPEGFSFLFCTIFYYILAKFRASGNAKLLYILPILMLLWVNLHLFFIFGLFLVGLFLVESIFVKDLNKNTKSLLQIFIVLIISCFINPNYHIGVLEPFLILREYGYMIAENQTIIFMYNRFGNGIYIHTLIVIAFSFLFSIIFIIKNKINYIPEVFLSLFFGILAISAIRGISFFGIFSIPIFAFFLTYFIQNELINKISLGVLGLVIMINMGSKNNYLAAKPKENFGLGLIKNIDKSAKFFKENNLQGPIFNNYDFGGYLIYELYPKEKVFVDNRPEAYSVSFFKEIYEPMQEKEDVWLKMEEKYKFNCIFFFRQDQTPHAQPFLIKRINDSSWIPVFVDDVSIILLKNNPQNESIIKKFGLPKTMFNSVPN